jgi:hypothetical protein
MSKKILFVLAVMLMVGIGQSYATGIPVTTDPKNFPTVWIEEVYNGSGSDIATERVVSWDFDTSDSDESSKYDDMCPWVKVAPATDLDVWTAGVSLTRQGIANGAQGVIIIRGPAVVYDGTGVDILTADDIVSASATAAGQCEEVSSIASDQTMLGICIKSNATNQGNKVDALIYVDPTIHFDD